MLQHWNSQTHHQRLPWKSRCRTLWNRLVLEWLWFEYSRIIRNITLNILSFLRNSFYRFLHFHFRFNFSLTLFWFRAGCIQECQGTSCTSASESYFSWRDDHNQCKLLDTYANFFENHITTALKYFTSLVYDGDGARREALWTPRASLTRKNLKRRSRVGTSSTEVFDSCVATWPLHILCERHCALWKNEKASFAFLLAQQGCTSVDPTAFNLFRNHHITE